MNILKSLILFILTFILISTKKIKTTIKKDILNDTKEIIENVTSYVADIILSPLAKELHNAEDTKKERRKYSKKNLLNKIIPHNSTKNNTNYRNEPNHIVEATEIEKDIKNFIADKNDTYINEIYNDSETLNEVYNTINWTVIYDNMKEIENENKENETLIEEIPEEVKVENEVKEDNNENKELNVQQPESGIQQDEILQEPIQVVDEKGDKNPIIQPPKEINVNVEDNDKDEQELEIEQFDVNDVAEDDYSTEEPEENLNDGIPEENDEKKDYYNIQPIYPQQPYDYPQQPQQQLIEDNQQKNQEPENYPEEPEQIKGVNQQYQLPQEPENYPEEPEQIKGVNQQLPQEPENYPEEPEQLEDVKQETENHHQKEVNQQSYQDTINDIVEQVTSQIEQIMNNDEKEEKQEEKNEIPELIEEKIKEEIEELKPEEPKEKNTEENNVILLKPEILPEGPFEREEEIKNEEEKKKNSRRN